MEAIAALVSEFLAILLAPVIGLLVEGILAIGMLIIQLMSSILEYFGFKLLSKFKSSKRDIEVKKSQRFKKIKKIVKYSFLFIFILSFGIALIIDHFYLKESFDWISEKIESKTNIKIEVRDIQGSLFTGNFSVKDVNLHRKENELSNFDINVEEAFVDLSLLSFLSSEVFINQLEVKGVNGDFTRLKKKKRLKVRKGFIIHDFVVEDLSLDVIDRTTEKSIHFPMEISSLHSTPLESRYLIFNILFRSNINGKIDGHDFKISFREIESGRKTEWKANKLPISKIAKFTKPPLSWIKEGEIDIAVDDYWKLGDKNEIDTEWALVLRGVKAKVPSEVGLMKKGIYVPIVGLLNSKSKELELNFGFTLNKGDFEFIANPDSDIIWQKFKEGILMMLEKESGVKKEDIKVFGKKGWNKFKYFVKQKEK